ncbi:MAG: response regulator [Acidobacteriota bacterium]
MNGETAKTLLIVDDEPGVRLVLERMLQRLGYGVLSAETARQGLEAVAEHGEISLIVLDLGLPDMKGEAVLERLADMGSGLPVLVSSGASAEELEALMAKQGAVAGVLRKPFRLPELEQAVARCFEAG